MALVGWTPPNEKEQMDVSEMTKVFDLKDINTANPIFDTQKLEWFNGVWIRSIGDLSERLIEFYKQDPQVIKVLKSDKSKIWVTAAKSRIKTLKDFKKLISIKKKKKYTMEEKQKARILLKYLNYKLGKVWKDEELLFALKDFSDKEEMSFKKIYYLMTGKEQGIGILELNKIYGKYLFVKNLKDA